MTTSQVPVTDQMQRTDPRGLTSTGERARERLLAGLPVTERRLTLAGVSTAVLEGGEGPPVILLHGPGEYAAKWLRVIPDLAATHRVIVPDLPGHGTSVVVDNPLDVDHVLAWLDDLIECTCATPPVLVGQILGGAIAARFAIAHGERIDRLVLSDALGLAAFQPEPAFGQALTAFISDPTEDAHDRLWDQCAFDLDTLRSRVGERWTWIKAYNVDRARSPAVQAAQRSLMEAFGFPPIPPAELARIPVTTSLIWGRHDLATPLAVAEDASARYGWPLYVVDAAADDPPMEQPEAFLDALRSALDAPEDGVAPDGDTRAAWDEIAPGFDRTNTPTQMRLGSEGLRRAGLREGMRFLDVASGSGALSIPAARMGAEVVATDQSPVMLELLRARSDAEGLGIETRVENGHALTFADDTFDMVGSQFGVMLFPDMPRGIREMVRVARPGGRVLLHAYGNPHQIDFLAFFVRAIQSVRPGFAGLPTDPPPLEFQLADPERLRAEFDAAGLRDIRVDVFTETTEFADGAALWDWIVYSNPIAERVLGSLNLTSGDIEAIRRELEGMVRDRAGGSGAATLANPVNIGIGTK